MRKAMREPLFVEFVDECLRVIQPQPLEITDEQVRLSNGGEDPDLDFFARPGLGNFDRIQICRKYFSLF
jgi:hypothetical protein